jgi:hypothetical protein
MYDVWQHNALTSATVLGVSKEIGCLFIYQDIPVKCPKNKNQLHISSAHVTLAVHVCISFLLFVEENTCIAYCSVAVVIKDERKNKKLHYL